MNDIQAKGLITQMEALNANLVWIIRHLSDISTKIDKLNK